ncbi:MAG: pantoate--beta-alanine ligase [Deltaproteobacteria bacterium]|nr:pantoate--beta-alanine ligase [Deltaproteobacteria bacterium]
MELVETPDAMVAWAERHRHDRVGLVPTMGYLHRGHVSLMELLRPRVDRLVVSIFVNPLQFGANEDLAVYPRDPERDAEKCRLVGVDCIFQPQEMYPEAFQTTVSVGDLTRGLCGARRPGHFEGVCTVVTRLFGLTRCDEACFGEKDYQQLMVIRRMVEDLALPVTIVPGPLVRDADGLALSSRNAFLSVEERRRGLSLHRALLAMADAAAAGEVEVPALLDRARGRLDVDRPDYLEVVDAQTMQPLEVVDRPARALVAAFLGRTRLIDNLAVGPELSWT